MYKSAIAKNKVQTLFACRENLPISRKLQTPQGLTRIILSSLNISGSRGTDVPRRDPSRVAQLDGEAETVWYSRRAETPSGRGARRPPKGLGLG
ncbi:hypothetical protein KL941_001465 [Ogataea angusta]|nr:hypothetical protein KL941_001465 [Ogataea angusta]